MTRHRLPRWFTEGLAVHEETATNPEWGDRLTPDILTAMKKKMLLPIATLDRGFIRPAYPAQIVVSYFQAGRVCDYIEQRWGWEKLLSMIQAFSQVVSTAEVIEKQLGLKPEQFDKDFLAWLEAEHAKALKGYEEWEAGRKKLLALLKAKDPAALELARSLKDLYPEYVEAGSMYEVLAGLYSQAGDKPAEEKILQEYVKAGGRSPALFKRLAELQEAAGRKADAEATLAKVLAIDPVRDEEVHRRLGDLRVALGKWDRAAEEYAAVVAMKPVDLAGAYFNLARALAGAGKREEAREQVLMALEAAPGYRPAQRLLLELTDGPSKKD
jgi:tetratricopeptide (TPR) repeat protein